MADLLALLVLIVLSLAAGISYGATHPRRHP